MSAEPSLAELKAAAAKAAAEAAAAKAEAAAAKAAAAQAAYEAAAAHSQPADPPQALEQEAEAAPPQPSTDNADAEAASSDDGGEQPGEMPAKQPAADADGPGGAVPGGLDTEERTWVDEVAAGYTVEGQAIELGALLTSKGAASRARIRLPLAMMNRHGLITGATGTGKTRTLQLLAERLANAGVSTFVTDIKGDLTGLLTAGTNSPKLQERTDATGQHWQPQAFATHLYRLGEQGIGTPIRTTISDFGPLLLARVLELNDVQTSALQLIFHWADSHELALIDVADLRAVISYLTSDNGKAELKAIGGISTATAGVILRKITALSAEGGDEFFGEPAFEPLDFVGSDGVISLLELPAVHDRPHLVATFVMWLLASLYDSLPEVGDVQQPKLVFFFDEAHLLFDDAPSAFIDEVVKTVRLARSKGVGVFFITQQASDVPADVLAQLGARILHAERAYTPKESKRLKETVATLPTSRLDLFELLPSLGIGQAVVTVLDRKGRPTPVAPTLLDAPAAVMGEAPADQVEAAVAATPRREFYEQSINPESAEELLAKRLVAEQQAAAAEEAAKAAQAELEKQRKLEEKQRQAAEKAAEKERERRYREMERQLERDRKAAEKAAQRRGRVVEDIMRTAGRTITREISRTIFGTRRRR